MTQPITQLVVRDAAGDVHVSTGSGSAVGVTENQTYRGSPPSSVHTVSGGTLTLTYTCPSGSCGIDYTVDVPAGLAVQASAGDVKITLPGAVGYAVTATADAGTTHVTVPTSPGSAHVIQAESDAGDVSVLAG